MNPQSPQNTELKNFIISIARGIAFVSLVFVIVVIVLLVVTNLHYAGFDLHDYRPLQEMIKQYHSRSDDVILREQIRLIDFMLRRDYFRTRAFVRTGCWLVLAGLAMFFLAMHLVGVLEKKIVPPSKYSEGPVTRKISARARLAISIAGGVISVIAMLIIVFTPVETDSFLSQSNTGNATVFREEFKQQSTDITTRWSNFRGPCGLAIASGKDYPTGWDTASGSNILWKSPVLREGASSPVVWSNRLIITGADTEIREVFCYESETGELLWRHAVSDIEGSPETLPSVSEETGYAAPTPATDGERVFALFAMGDLVCLDMQNGFRLWGKNISVPQNHYGHASSLMVYGNKLLVQYDDNSSPRLIAFDVQTGEMSWSVLRSAISWASPICVNTGKRTELILVNSEEVSSYNPVTGSMYWSVKCLGGEVAVSPAFWNGMVFVANEGAVACGIKITEGDSYIQPKIIWKYENNLPDVASLLVISNRFFMASSGGTITCLDSSTGTLLWEHEFGDGFYASPVFADGLIYALDRKGTMHIFRCADKYEPVGEGKIREEAVATPAFVHSRIFIRGKKNLFCIARK